MLDILEIIGNGVSNQTNLLYQSRLSSQVLNRYIDALLRGRFITRHVVAARVRGKKLSSSPGRTRTGHTLTPKGHELRGTLRRTRELLSETA